MTYIIFCKKSNTDLCENVRQQMPIFTFINDLYTIQSLKLTSLYFNPYPADIFLMDGPSSIFGTVQIWNCPFWGYQGDNWKFKPANQYGLYSLV